MDIIKQLNNAIAYIEENLCNEIDTNLNDKDMFQ